MKGKRKISVFCLVAAALLQLSFALSQEMIPVRIFAHLRIRSVTLSIYSGSYRMQADGFFVAGYRQGMPVTVEIKSDSLIVSQEGRELGIYQSVKFFGDEGSEMKVKLNDPERKLRSYQQHIGLDVSEGSLRLLNELELDNYIAGVTEAETGSRSGLELYKAQSILARTFALSHINKHLSEGFSLCDQVHCQAYFGRPRDLTVFKAIAETKGKVVVDENLNLIVAAFHSNSGGMTANSEDVWGSHTPYLRSVQDSFSIRMPNARWHRKMLTEDWLTYLELKHQFPVKDPQARETALHFTQEYRKTFLESNLVRVPLKNIRMDLQLKSTFFNISPLGKDSVLFSGFGYGHGLGMPQEGAMRMVKLGYSYLDVLHFYFQDVQLIDLHKLSFFKDE